ncbi:MAG TPA: 4-(cytidine 5'-diphospho)-2-C-methyl-D-erythritol kinase, partial [Blastocatellia bacterium]|nr:4-(cytidine 5'-diphospho)-2-C-methyl-D-erythritol kinase [Blastocatellia bacterium]
MGTLFYFRKIHFYPFNVSRTRLILPSFAKVNLGLKVISRRPDGFHDIFTVFQTTSLKDTITFAPSDKIRLTCTDPNIPVDGTNIILKAVDALKERYSIRNGVTIHLDKNIPSPGGLGGGSSNAAVTLLALRRLWGLDVSTDDLVATARSLGSDVPFFLVGGTAIGSGRGTEIEPIDDIG